MFALIHYSPMLASELITQAVLPLRTSDTGEVALLRMDELKVSHLPIVNNLEFLGLLSESDILGLNDPHAAVGEHRLSLGRIYVEEGQHIYEILRLFDENKLSLVPVLNFNRHYLGVITREDLVHYITTITSTDQPGGVIVLEVPDSSYSLSEITQIVESNDGKILSLFTRSFKNSNNMEVTLKINQLDLSAILQSFNRYSYEVKASFSESRYYDDLMENYKGLMNYLNI